MVAKFNLPLPTDLERNPEETNRNDRRVDDRNADEYNLCIVATNHVVDAIPSNQSHQAQVQANGRVMSSSGRAVLPALGLVWSQCVSSRYFVSRTMQYLDYNKYNTSGVVRRFDVVFSSKQAIKSSMYIINQFGIWGVPESCLGDTVTKDVN